MPKAVSSLFAASLLAALGCSSGPPVQDYCGTVAPAQVQPDPAKHEAPHASCEQLDRDAEALLAQHNECSSDDDCMFVRDEGGCPRAFACAVVVNKRHADAFTPLASELSRTYFAHCGRCARVVAECQVMTPACTRGRCSVRSDP